MDSERWPGGLKMARSTEGDARGRRGLSIEVESLIAGSVWKIQVKVGDEVEEEEILLIIESMKMEIPVEAPEGGQVLEIRVQEGQAVEEGDVLVVLAN